MATQKAAFNHPIIVRRILQMWKEGIPSQYLGVKNLVPPGMIQKSITKAAELRTLGDASYYSRNFDEAMLYYSKSVATAPADTEELALAYCNRSAVFLYRKLYEPCLLDVNRALAGPLSPRARETVLQRKTIAWNRLRDQKIRRTGMKEGILYMKRSRRLEPITLNAYERRLCYVSKVGVDDVDLVVDHSQLDDPIWNAKFDGTSLENVSPKIELKYDAQLGPHLVAKDDIEPGEPLWFDAVFSFVLLESMKLKYCNYCHLRCEALIPCAHCTAEMYCSTGCRKEAYDSYHRVECRILPLWVDAEGYHRETRVLCLRTFLQTTKQGSELANLKNNLVVYYGLDVALNSANMQLSPENYPELLGNVVSKLGYLNDEKKACYQSVLRETIAILASLNSLQFFRSEDGSAQRSGYSLSELVYSAITLLVYQMSLMWSHYFYVKYYLVDTQEAEPLRGNIECVGHGFSVLQCFTHQSCDPNIGTVTNKRRTLAYSLRSIKAGEQIRRAHLAKYTRIPRDERKIMYNYLGLRSECTCKACVENWPEYSELASRIDTYRLRDERALLRIQTMRERLAVVTFSEEDLQGVIEFSKTIREYVNEPSFTIFMCEDYIETMMFYKGDLFVDFK